MPLLNILRRGAIVTAVVAALAPSAAVAAPDPGGNELADLPIPPPNGQKFGFNTQRFEDGSNILNAGEEVDLESQLGAQVQRFGITWSSLDYLDNGVPIDNATALAALDQMVGLLRQAGIRPIFTFLQAPAWAGPDPSPSPGRARHPDADHVDEFAAFVAAIASHFDDGRASPDVVIEPWNEPNLASFWGPSTDPALMARVQCAAYDAVKALPHPNMVLAPGFTFADGSGNLIYTGYVGSMYADPVNGLNGCMDALSIHPYPATPPGQVAALGTGSFFADEWQRVRALRLSYADTSPIWITETGTSSYATGPLQASTSEDKQCDSNRRLYDKLLTMPDDIEVVLFHTLADTITVQTLGSQGEHYGFYKGPQRSAGTHHQMLKPVGNEFKAKFNGTADVC
jgi:Cellulase (glycosyl hydrolase family 5)